ncbi:MAG: mechanosensitive ion channel family protein [Gammaproteobacteria bacterium]
MDKPESFLSRELFEFGEQTVTVSQLLVVPVVLVVGFALIRVGGRLLNRYLVRSELSPDVIQFSGRAFYIVALGLLAVTILDILNLPLGAFAFVSGAVAIGVGFGAQNLINNFISGWILIWERPIRIGDFLEFGEDRGEVEAIHSRYTRIKRVDGVRMLVPNSALLENTVVNWTIVDRDVRGSVIVGVQYGSPTELVRELMERVVDEHPKILKEPEPRVLFMDFGDNSLIFEVFFWVRAEQRFSVRIARSDVRFAIDKVFREHGIVVAFPQRDVHIDGSLFVDRGEDSAEPSEPA